MQKLGWAIALPLSRLGKAQTCLALLSLLARLASPLCERLLLMLRGQNYKEKSESPNNLTEKGYPSLVPSISLDLSVESAHVDVHRPRTRLGHQSTSTHGARCLLGSAMLKSVSALLSLNRSLIISLAIPSLLPRYAKPL